jgi:hypothetical protein
VRLNGKDPAQYTFADLSAADAAAQMQATTSDIKAIMTWNLYLRDTLRKRPDARVTSGPEAEVTRRESAGRGETAGVR